MNTTVRDNLVNYTLNSLFVLTGKLPKISPREDFDLFSFNQQKTFIKIIYSDVIMVNLIDYQQGIRESYVANNTKEAFDLIDYMLGKLRPRRLI